VFKKAENHLNTQNIVYQGNQTKNNFNRLINDITIIILIINN
jgi:hypothetical protein